MYCCYYNFIGVDNSTQRLFMVIGGEVSLSLVEGIAPRLLGHFVLYSYPLYDLDHNCRSSREVVPHDEESWKIP